MILLDANILIYAYNPGSQEHQIVREWFEDKMRGPEPIGIPWISMWAFLRIATNRTISPTLISDEAFEAARSISQHPWVRMVGPSANHINVLERMATDGQSKGARLTDAALAAIAIEHGASLASTDRDFSRFPGLKWINPLDSAK